MPGSEYGSTFQQDGVAKRQARQGGMVAVDAQPRTFKVRYFAGSSIPNKIHDEAIFSNNVWRLGYLLRPDLINIVLYDSGLLGHSNMCRDQDGGLPV